MTMADETRLNILVKEYSKSLTDDLITEAITKADDRATRYLKKHIENYTIPDETPSEIIDAATLFAAQGILDILGTGRDQRNPTAIQWEKEAFEALDDYIDAYTDDNDITERGVPIFISTIYDPTKMEEDEEEESEE